MVVGDHVTLAVLVGATVIAALPKLRTSSLVAHDVRRRRVVVLLAGSLVLGASAEQGGAGSAEPTGRGDQHPRGRRAPNFHFQADNFDVPAGITRSSTSSKGGTHTLVFDEPQFPYFELAVPGGKNAAKVDASQGQTYTIYCTIPGHRAAGMQATITVGAPGGGKPEAGHGDARPPRSPAARPPPLRRTGQSEVDQSPAGRHEPDGELTVRRTFAAAAAVALGAVAARGLREQRRRRRLHAADRARRSRRSRSSRTSYMFTPTKITAPAGILEFKLKSIESGIHDSFRIKGVAGFRSR